MLPLSWMNSSSSAGSSHSDYEERNRVSSFRGYLYKLRRSQNLLAPQWGKRWFSIEGHFLKWYRHEQDMCSSGMVDLKYIRSIHKLENSAYGNYTFLINCEERNLILRCTTLNEMNQWVRALHIQADIARGGTGMNVVSDFNQMPLNYSQMKSRKPGKLRTSMSMEQELDFHLKKLNELEQAVLSTNPSESELTLSTATSSVQRTVSKGKKPRNKKQYDDGEDHDELDEEDTSSSLPDEEDEDEEHHQGKNRRGIAEADFEEVGECFPASTSSSSSRRSHNHNNSNGNSNTGNSRPSKTSSNTATATSSSPPSNNHTNSNSNSNSNRRKDPKRLESSADSMEDSYDLEDAVPIRAPVKRQEDPRHSSNRTMERIESIEDIQLVSTKVSRSKQKLKEQQQYRTKPLPQFDSDFDSPLKQSSTEDHEDEFDFAEIIPVSKSSSAASANALHIQPSQPHKAANYAQTAHQAEVNRKSTDRTTTPASNSNNNNNSKNTSSNNGSSNVDKEDSVRSSRTRPTKSAWD